MAMKINKEKKLVWIFTDNYKITGYIHIVENSRISDAMAAASKKLQFLPVTDATIKFNNGKEIKENFILVQVKSIEIIFEADSEVQT